MFSTFRTRMALPAVFLLAALVLPMSASAHERRTIAGGKYDVVVGWELEPAWVPPNRSRASIGRSRSRFVKAPRPRNSRCALRLDNPVRT